MVSAVIVIMVVVVNMCLVAGDNFGDKGHDGDHCGHGDCDSDGETLLEGINTIPLPEARAVSPIPPTSHKKENSY